MDYESAWLKLSFNLYKQVVKLINDGFLSNFCVEENMRKTLLHVLLLYVWDVGDEFLHLNLGMRLFIVHVYTAHNCNKNMHLVTSSF